LAVAVGYGWRCLVAGSGKFARAVQIRAVEHQTRREKLLGEAKKMENSCRGLRGEQLDEKRDRVAPELWFAPLGRQHYTSEEEWCRVERGLGSSF
jgi:hypothetical protein